MRNAEFKKLLRDVREMVSHTQEQKRCNAVSSFISTCPAITLKVVSSVKVVHAELSSQPESATRSR